MSDRFQILLYYKYVDIPCPEKIQRQQKRLCERLDLKGRILLSEEGINGTVAGTPEHIAAYQKETASQNLFSDIEWKISESEEQVFPRLRVVVRDEIVTLGMKKLGKDVRLNHKATYIEPEELCDLYDKQEEFTIIDARNGYEADIGKFKNALTPEIANFRDFPAFVETLADYKDKPVITYCTGGVRCEKASAYLKEQGFTNVRQLHGGIHRYAEKTGGKHFDGEMFVFDKRLHIPVNNVNPTTITNCVYCHTPITRYVDCAIASCDSLFICCPDCQSAHFGACSPECQQQVLQSSQI